MAMPEVVLRPLRVGEVLDVAIKLYRANFATLVKAVLVFVAPTQILGALITASMRADDFPTSFGESFDPEAASAIDMSDLVVVAVGALLVTVLGVITAQLASAASFQALSTAYLGGEPDWKQTLGFAFGKLWPLLWLGFLHALCLGIGFLLLIVPGVYLYGAFSVAVPVLLLENVRGTKALGRSRRLVEDRWWPVAAVLVLTAILSSIVSGAVTALVVGASFSPANQIVSDVVGVIGGIAASLLTTPFAAAVSLVLYIDLRVRKEGFDLELLAQRIGADETTVRPPSFLPPAPIEPAEDPDDRPPFWPPPPGWQPRSKQ